MADSTVSRRCFLTGASLAATMTATGAEIVTSSDPIERARSFRVRPQTLERIVAGREAFLAEMKPTKAQIARGLELHFDRFVADVQGSVQVSYIGGLQSDQMREQLRPHRNRLQEEGLEGRELARELGKIHFKHKPFESTFDRQWIEESKAIYAMTHVQMGTEDVAGPNENRFESALDRLARIDFVYQQRPDLIRVSGPADMERARREKLPSTIYHLAGVGCFAEAEDPIARLDLFHAVGVRMSQLTYIQDNKVCCSWMQENDTGLKPLGRQVVGRMNQLGMMVDLAHAGERSSLEVVEASLSPVMISHTACSSIYEDTDNAEYVKRVMAQPYAKGVAYPKKTGRRNATDELIRAVAKRNGLVAIYTIDFVLGTGPESFRTWYRHLEHAIEVAGIDHVGIGADRTYIPGWRPGPLDWTNWPYWTVGLVCQGHSDDDIRKIIGGNYRRFASEILDAQPTGSFM